MKPQRVAAVLAHELPTGEQVLVAKDRSQAVVLNPVGSVVWQLCDGRRTTEQIASFVAESFPAQEAAQIARDVQSFVDELCAARLVADAAEGAPGCGDVTSEP